MGMLSTGELAEEADVNIETVRYYERRGLMPEPPRNGAGHRRYEPEHLRRLHFIRRAQQLGFTLEEISELLSLRAKPDASNVEVKRRTGAKIEEVAGKIRDLERMKATLEDLYEACDGEGAASECPILQAMGMPEENGKVGRRGRA